MSPLMPHCFYDGPGLFAAIHVTAALGTAGAMVEWRYFNLEAQLYGGVLTPVNGQISVPRARDWDSTRLAMSFATI